MRGKKKRNERQSKQTLKKLEEAHNLQQKIPIALLLV